ncbi:efflux RND transporter periplasmic adaptor subunit [Aureibacter tunicatorum]|uniref:HlyD family secretion protein n=1 Tax=Aureibacter tunicatorum TaxID=866807 RepID=A0AAE3XHN3_9BACT|nr:efflux RND transporter periplasmic adaptor subunit [Aureibacter tunicatorum]MDR6237876.1 HlyD family secretion protein [Aureibacter tunicatorum]BDD02911.1 ABC transporter permease [Aureibacter tunicatorum]
MDKKIHKKRTLPWKTWVGLFAGMLVLGYLAYTARNRMRVMRVSADRIEVANAIWGEFEERIVISSKVKPIQTIVLDAIEGGRVTNKYLDGGNMVSKGDQIISLENMSLYQAILNSEASLAEKENYLRNTQITFETELIQSRKNLLETEFQLSKTKRQYEQKKRLLEKGLIPREEYLDAKDNYLLQKETQQINRQKAKNDSLFQLTAIHTLQEDLLKMRKNLSHVQSRLKALEVTSPIDGQLGTLEANIGESISPGERIGVVHDLSDYKLEAEIDEHYIDRINVGMHAEVRRSAKVFNLSIAKIFPEVKEGKFKAELKFEKQSPQRMRTGQHYTLYLNLDEARESIMLPRGAFTRSSGGRWVFVMDETGKRALKRDIKTGKQNDKYIEVLSGLSEGERVLISSYESFEKYEELFIE